MLSDVIKKYGGEKMDPLDVYKDIFRIGEGFIQKEYEDSGSFKANPIAYYKNENEDHGRGVIIAFAWIPGNTPVPHWISSQ